MWAFVIGFVIACCLDLGHEHRSKEGIRAVFLAGFFFTLVASSCACLSDSFESSYERHRLLRLLDRDHRCQRAESLCLFGRARQSAARNAAKASRTKIPPSEGTKWTTCSTCGKRGTWDYARIRKRCPDCGAPYDLEFAEPEVEAAEAPEESKSDGFDSRMEAPAEAPPEEEWACGRCDKANQPSARFCMYCGAPKQADWACPACGAQNPPVAKYCMMCGTQKEG
jgi:ribosomal protein L40E